MSRFALNSRFFVPSLTSCQESGGVFVHAGSDDDFLSGNILTLFVRALDWVTRELDAERPECVRMFVYPTMEDFVSAFGKPVSAGWMACPLLGAENLVVIQSPSSSGVPMQDMFYANLVHEAGHIVFNKRTDNSHDSPHSPRWPMWLEEGICCNLMPQHLTDPAAWHLKRLEGARIGCRRLALSDLTSAFPLLDQESDVPDSELSLIAYDLAYAAVYYLTRVIGKTARNDFLARLRDADDFEDTLEGMTGYTTEKIQEQLLGRLTSQGSVLVWGFQDSASP